MRKEKINVILEFAGQLANYLKVFGMSETDLGYAIGTSSTDVVDILSGAKTVGFERAERIANVFGMAYFEMGNPDYPLPAFEDLPESTKKLIRDRLDNGTPERNYEIDFAGNLDKVIYSVYLSVPRSIKEIWLKLPDSVREQVDSRRVYDLMSKAPRFDDFDVFPAVEGKAGRYALKGKWTEEQDVVLREQLKAKITKEKVAKPKEKSEKKAK